MCTRAAQRPSCCLHIKRISDRKAFGVLFRAKALEIGEILLTFLLLHSLTVLLPFSGPLKELSQLNRSKKVRSKET